MKKLAMILGLCAFIAAPAFAEGEATTTTEAPAAHDAAAPAHAGKSKVKKGKRGAKKSKKEAAAPEAPKN